MSLADRDHMRAARPGSVTRMDGRTIDGVVLEGRPARPAMIRAARRHRSPLRLVLIGAAVLGAFTGAWAIGCGFVGASLHTEGGTFVPPGNNHRKQGE